jgi:uncharacterized repeat protein (TIGR04076 family)
MSESQEFRNIEMTEEFKEEVLAGINICYEEVTIKKVNGECPYGHRQGDTHRVTAMNTDGLCGSLYHTLYPAVMSLQYHGNAPWENDKNRFQALCPEMGKVQVDVRRFAKDDSKLFRTKTKIKDMTGRGYANLDKYRVFIEILGVENHCAWAQRPGQRFEIDHFNIGKLCGCLYWGAYHFMEILYSEGRVPWEFEDHIIHGVCPDIFNQCSFRLIREKR